MPGNLDDRLLAATGKRMDDAAYVGKRVRGRKGTDQGSCLGVVERVSCCHPQGCGGTRLHVHWDNGQWTYVCTKSCTSMPDGSLEVK